MNGSLQEQDMLASVIAISGLFYVHTSVMLGPMSCGEVLLLVCHGNMADQVFN